MDSGSGQRDRQASKPLGFDVFGKHIGTQLKERHYRVAICGTHAEHRELTAGRLALKGQPTEIGFHICVGKTGGLGDDSDIATKSRLMSVGAVKGF